MGHVRFSQHLLMNLRVFKSLGVEEGGGRATESVATCCRGRWPHNCRAPPSARGTWRANCTLLASNQLATRWQSGCKHMPNMLPPSCQNGCRHSRSPRGGCTANRKAAIISGADRLAMKCQCVGEEFTNILAHCGQHIAGHSCGKL